MRLTSSTFPSKILQSAGAFQSYTNFLLNEFDPLFAANRMAAEVIDIIEETQQARTLVLRPSIHWKGYTPGQYVPVEIDINGVRHRRHYSISSAPSEFKHANTIRISIKCVEGGLVSNYLHEQLSVGDLIYIGPATGDFTLNSTLLSRRPTKISPPESSKKPNKRSSKKPLLFVAAGSGITPIMAMLEALAEHGKQYKEQQTIHLIYFAKSKSEMIFFDRLNQLAASLPGFRFLSHFTDTQGRVTEQVLKTDCPNLAEHQWYICGPQGFMDSVRNAASTLGIAKKDIKSEAFGTPSTTLALSDYLNAKKSKPILGQVSFSASGKTIESKGKQTLLELAESAGLKPKYGCRSGICHECKCSKISGQVLNTLSGEIIPEAQQLIQACISVPIGDVSIETW